MALIPTVFVSTVVKDQVGKPVQGAVVEAKLTTVDRWQGYVVPKSYKGLTGADGICRLAVFPNELGTESSEYLFTIKLPDGTGFSALATVPDRDCHLHDITELEPYELRGTGAVITSEVAAYADTAAKASRDALKSAQEARLFAMDAVPDEDDPQSFGSAKYHAEHAAQSAKAAADWAESGNSPGGEGTKSSKRWAESMTEHGNFSVFRIIFVTKLCLHRLSVRFRELLAKAEEKVNGLVLSVEGTLRELVGTASSHADRAEKAAEEARLVGESVLEVQDNVIRHASSAQEQADRAASMAGAAAGSARDAADSVVEMKDFVAQAKEDLDEVARDTINTSKSWAEEAHRQADRVEGCADTACECASASQEVLKRTEQARDEAVAFVGNLAVAHRLNWVQQEPLSMGDLVEVPDHEVNDGSLVIWCSGLLLQPVFEYEEIDRTHIRILSDVPGCSYWCAIVVTGMNWLMQAVGLSQLLWYDYEKTTDPDFLYDSGTVVLTEDEVDFSYKTKNGR